MAVLSYAVLGHDFAEHNLAKGGGGQKEQQDGQYAKYSFFHITDIFR